MNSVLVVHLALGILVALCAALFVWRKAGRRITLYLLTLQIIIGIYLLSTGLKAPSAHFLLAFLGAAGYMAANVMVRKPEQARNALVVTIISSLMVVAALVLGLKAGGMM